MNASRIIPDSNLPLQTRNFPLFGGVSLFLDTSSGMCTCFQNNSRFCNGGMWVLVLLFLSSSLLGGDGGPGGGGPGVGTQQGDGNGGQGQQTTTAAATTTEGTCMHQTGLFPLRR